jgi:hypothetical protein
MVRARFILKALATPEILLPWGFGRIPQYHSLLHPAHNQVLPDGDSAPESSRCIV